MPTGDHAKVKALDKRVAELAGFYKNFKCVGQTYGRYYYFQCAIFKLSKSIVFQGSTFEIQIFDPHSLIPYNYYITNSP